MAPPPPRQPPELPEDLISEILLHLPPEEPANLLRASLVCKSWCGLLSDPVFRRRYCRYHRTPPLLGFLHREMHDPRIVSTVASPCSPPALDCPWWGAWDCRHGRVLIHHFDRRNLVVFDPLTGEQQHLPLLPFPYPRIFYTGAVLCAVAGCDHLDCHSGPFLVVFVGTEDDGPTWASVYSSETGAWSAPSSIVTDSRVEAWPNLRIGDLLYFMTVGMSCILRYDLAQRALSVINVPAEYEEMSTVVMVEDGRLGFVGVEDHSLHLWSWQEAGADGSAGWKRCKVIELATLLPISDTTDSIGIVGFVEGRDVVCLSIDAGIFTLEIKSGRVTKVGEPGVYFSITPYTSFWLP